MKKASKPMPKESKGKKMGKGYEAKAMRGTKRK